MKNEKNQTLREYLDMIGVKEGSGASLTIQEFGKSTEMQVSRRYIESAPWEYLLDLEIYDYIYPYYDIYGNETIKIILADRSK